MLTTARGYSTNLEVVDLDVYWSLCGQLLLATRGLAPGSSITDVSIGD